jgi:hypothetical protein
MSHDDLGGGLAAAGDAAVHAPALPVYAYTGHAAVVAASVCER